MYISVGCPDTFSVNTVKKRPLTAGKSTPAPPRRRRAVCSDRPPGWLTTICRCPNSVTAFSRVFLVGGANFSGTEVGWAYSSKYNGKSSFQYTTIELFFNSLPDSVFKLRWWVGSAGKKVFYTSRAKSSSSNTDTWVQRCKILWSNSRKERCCYPAF